MAIERKDKLKNKAEVAKALINDPTLTDREIEKETWVSKSAANRARQEMGQDGTQGEIMDRILAMDDKIIELANGLHLKTIQDKLAEWKELTLQDNKLIWDLANNSTKRKAIFGKKEEEGDNTIQVIIG